MEGWINEMAIPDCNVGLYLGGMKQSDLDISATRRVVIATYNMAEEAFDCKALNTLIYATPHNNIEQAVGRVLREEKRRRCVVPLIIDLQDTFSSFDKWNRIREKYYKSKGYPMKVFDVSDPIQRGPASADKLAPTPVIKFIKDINPKEKTTRIRESNGNASDKGAKKNKKVSKEDDESEDDEPDDEEIELDF
jgi:superfamily II DNA or RNA helicase